MTATSDRIRTASAYLRARACAELIQPLTMEWITRGRDEVEHAQWRAEVEKLLAEQPG